MDLSLIHISVATAMISTQCGFPLQLRCPSLLRDLYTLRAAAIPQSGKISLLRRAHTARRVFISQVSPKDLPMI